MGLVLWLAQLMVSHEGNIEGSLLGESLGSDDVSALCYSDGFFDITKHCMVVGRILGVLLEFTDGLVIGFVDRFTIRYSYGEVIWTTIVVPFGFIVVIYEGSEIVSLVGSAGGYNYDNTEGSFFGESIESKNRSALFSSVGLFNLTEDCMFVGLILWVLYGFTDELLQVFYVSWIIVSTDDEVLWSTVLVPYGILVVIEYESGLGYFGISYDCSNKGNTMILLLGELLGLVDGQISISRDT